MTYLTRMMVKVTDTTDANTTVSVTESTGHITRSMSSTPETTPTSTAGSVTALVNQMDYGPTPLYAKLTHYQKEVYSTEGEPTLREWNYPG